MIRRALAAIVATTVASAAMAAAAPDDAPSLVTDAEHAFAQLRYDEALRLLDRAWRRGDSGPTAMRTIFALAGQAAGSIGDDDNARLWFSRWLCVEPHAELPGGTSPKLTALFGDARTALAGASIRGHVVRGDRTVAVIDPLALIDTVRLGRTRAPVHAGVAVFDTPIAGTLELLDRYGNVLAVAEPQIPITAMPRITRQWYELPAPWAITAGSFAVIAGGSLWVAIDARSQIGDLNRTSASHEFLDTRPLQQRFDRANLVTDVALGGAIITAAMTTVLWLHGEREVTVTPTGAAIAWQF